MSPLRQLLIGAHIAIGVVIIVVLCRFLGERALAVDEIRAVARQEREDTRRMHDEMELKKALRDGLRANDPYVVELLAREKLHYIRPGEYLAPSSRAGGRAGPGIDKAEATGTK